MSGRVIPAACNWAELLRKTAPGDKKLMAAFKVKSDILAGNYVKAAAFNRTINWDYYQGAIKNKALVADFKEKFESTEIPVPSDDGQQAALEAKAAEDQVAVANYIKKVDQQIDDASVTLNNIKALPPFEQMTQSDILYWFPQLCKNQEPVPLSENQLMTSVHGVQFVETSTYQWPGDHGGWYKAFEENKGTDAAVEYRLNESQFPGNKFPAFFSSFPTEDFKESFALSDPLIQWEAVAHHPEFDANVNAIQAGEGVQQGLRA
jgi:hypothetical protein